MHPLDFYRIFSLSPVIGGHAMGGW